MCDKMCQRIGQSVENTSPSITTQCMCKQPVCLNEEKKTVARYTTQGNKIRYFCLIGITRIALLLIRIYQLFISPLKPNCCRYVPTCSAYAKEAFLLHGPIKGAILTLKRLLRCHPWGGYGYDPVPPRVGSRIGNIHGVETPCARK